MSEAAEGGILKNKPFYVSISFIYVVSVIVGFAFLSRYLEGVVHASELVSLGALGKLVGIVLFPLGLVLWISAPTLLVLRGQGIPLEGRDGPVLDGGTKKLVRTGPFQYVRNPMYIGYLTIFLSVALLIGSPLMAFVFWPLWVLQTHILLVKYEEKNLERRFGEEYRQYKEEVPRWIPRLWPGSGRRNLPATARLDATGPGIQAAARSDPALSRPRSAGRAPPGAG